MTTERIPTAADLGLMAGAPPFPPERLVTVANWQDPPSNRWAFQHVSELIPTARIARGEGHVWRLPSEPRDLPNTPIHADGRSEPLATFLERTYTDGIIVLHGGRVVMESYFNGMAARTRHLLMSVSKSVTSAVCGRLVGRGLLTPDDAVTAHLPELAGTSWDGCTVRHLLDMRAGTRFNEDYSNPGADVRVYEQIYLWRPRTNIDLPADITAYYATLGNERPHGGRFDYRSILTDVLAWVMERAAGARFADLVASELWRPMGAEDDAEVTVDGHGNAMADGGICCTLRDLARFGLLILRGGRRSNEQVIPRAWIKDTLTADPEVSAAFAAAPDAAEFPVGSYYRNQFWVIDPRGPIFMASGINGQTVLIHGPADVVVAKFSTWPVAWTPAFGITTRTGLIDLAERVAG
ncbi:MAG: beta-lactamase family protein [Actinomycetota bacterium]|nr:beta-lactamase family protein [Actinomycetota bacterium]